MPDSYDRPTRDHDSARGPLDADTRDAPPASEPGATSAQTHSHTADPRTASLPRQEREPGWVQPSGFVILRELGSGGMGVVYEARQAKLNRLVALKMLHTNRGDAQSLIRFLAEAEAVAAIKHPHVVQVYEIGQEPSGPFMALELLTGGTLSEQLRSRHRFAPRDAAELVAKLAHAVQAAHDLGIVHRDLKPGNVLFDEEGVPKITDFGLAKRTGGVDLTRTQAVMGTPAYMAPEQARGEARFVGAPADVWALGAILYELLTGKRAFDADDTWAILRKVTDEAPATHVPGLPGDLELIALKCLEKNPADRYPSAAALGADLESYLAGRSVSVRPAGPRERVVKWCRRNPVVAGFTAALVAVGLLGFAGVTWGFLRAEERGKQLAQANDTLGKANDDLKTSRDEQFALAGGLKITRDKLADQAMELLAANETARESGYLSDIALAHQLWKANDLVGMRAALARCPVSLRQWEWHYLDRLSRPQRGAYSTNGIPQAVAYSPDGKLLAYSTSTGTLVVRDLQTDKECFVIADNPSVASLAGGIAFHPNGKELAYVAGGYVRVVDLTTGKWEDGKGPKLNGVVVATSFGNPTVVVRYTPNGQLLAAGALFDPKLHTYSFVIRDAKRGEILSKILGFEAKKDTLATVASGAFNSDGSLFAASAVDSGIRVRRGDEALNESSSFPSRAWIWDVKTGKEVQQTACSGSQLSNLAFASDAQTLGFGRRGQVGELSSTDADFPPAERLDFQGKTARGSSFLTPRVRWPGRQKHTTLEIAANSTRWPLEIGNSRAQSEPPGGARRIALEATVDCSRTTDGVACSNAHENRQARLDQPVGGDVAESRRSGVARTRCYRVSVPGARYHGYGSVLDRAAR